MAADRISPWVREYCDLLPAGGSVLDLAAGKGRHSRYLSARGWWMTAIDRDISALEADPPAATAIIQADLEKAPWPFAVSEFDGIIVVNYLWRPLFPDIVDSLKSGGIVIYDTFSAGNEDYGRPRNPDFLLQPGELRAVFGSLEILAGREGYVADPGPAMRQAIVARKP